MTAQRFPTPYRALGALVFLTANLPGQVTTGQITGSVLDQSRAAVSEATVTVRSLETNATRKALTSRDGWFNLPELSAGAYEVSVEKQAFAKYVQGPIVVRVSEDANLRIQLSLAAVTDKVTVREDAPLLNTTNAEVG